MSSYISSNQGIDFTWPLKLLMGRFASVAGINRFPAVHLAIAQGLQSGHRRDKTGSRTFLGVPATSRKVTTFQLQTYLTSWTGTQQPSYGPLFQAALGAIPVSSAGLTVQAVVGTSGLETSTPHGLSVGSGVSFQQRATLCDDRSQPELCGFERAVFFNGSGRKRIGVNHYLFPRYEPAKCFSFDYWDPADAVSRVVAGGAVSQLEFAVNGDFHEFLFQGPAADVLDSTSFTAGQAGLNAFPAEPKLDAFDYSIVPGHLGQ